jgi:hypothetical protein
MPLVWYSEESELLGTAGALPPLRALPRSRPTACWSSTATVSAVGRSRPCSPRTGGNLRQPSSCTARPTRAPSAAAWRSKTTRITAFRRGSLAVRVGAKTPRLRRRAGSRAGAPGAYPGRTWRSRHRALRTPPRRGSAARRGGDRDGSGTTSARRALSRRSPRVDLPRLEPARRESSRAPRSTRAPRVRRTIVEAGAQIEADADLRELRRDVRRKGR